MFRIDILWIQQYFLYLKSGWQIQIPYVGNQILKFVSWNQNWNVISETFFDGMSSSTIHENFIQSLFCGSYDLNIIKNICVNDLSKLTYKGKSFLENNDVVLQMHILENYIKLYVQNAKKWSHLRWLMWHRLRWNIPKALRTCFCRY